jgi:hypothetical protein
MTAYLLGRKSLLAYGIDLETRRGHKVGEIIPKDA